MNITKEKLIEKYDLSSNSVKRFVESGDMVDIFIYFENTYSLNEIETRTLQEQSIAFLLGFIDEEGCDDMLSVALRSRIESEQMEIIDEVHQKIFTHI